jgi:hypothetical protein
MIKLTDILNEGRTGKDEINQQLINIKNPKELEKLIINMYNGDEEKLFMRLYTNVNDPKVHKAFFDAIKKELKRYPEGLV